MRVRLGEDKKQDEQLDINKLIPKLTITTKDWAVTTGEGGAILTTQQQQVVDNTKWYLLAAGGVALLIIVTILLKR